MSGAAVITALIARATPVRAVVGDRYQGDVLPEKTQLPALEVGTVSGADHHPLRAGASRRVTERVQVTAHAGTYPGAKALLRLVRAACADFLGDIAGVTDVHVRTDGQGPDMHEPLTGIRSQSQDFLVSFNEVA